jgi:hypothetical protein
MREDDQDIAAITGLQKISSNAAANALEIDSDGMNRCTRQTVRGDFKLWNEIDGSG